MKRKRNIIKIDEALCNGCGLCIDGCHEDALQLIDGKARVVSELYCDGLGACIGDCPLGAITIEEREAQPYDEIAVLQRIAHKGKDTIFAHLKHLKDHGETAYLKQGIEYLKSQSFNLDFLQPIISNDVGENKTVGNDEVKMACGCPGSMARSFSQPSSSATGHKSAPTSQLVSSQLTHWPIQLHLINPNAECFTNADVVLAADCTAYAYPDFHNRFLSNRKLAIACPKLDNNKEAYVAKLVDLINNSHINTLTVVIMEVPCCGGLMNIAKAAAEQADRRIPIKKVVIAVEGEIKEEHWV